jgi:hypothetical protein
MADQPLYHGGDLGVGEALQLGIDTDRIGFNVPVE